jgi:preprotein translocase subunit SecE
LLPILRLNGLSSAVRNPPQASEKPCKPAVGLTGWPDRYRNPHRLRPGNGLPRRTYSQKRIVSDPFLKGWVANPYLKSPKSESAQLQQHMAKISPFKFLQEVRAEGDKVTWPTRRETLITTIMVFVMVAATSIFFTVADQVIRIVITFILGIAG